jgi:hypothetical protein
MSMDHLTDEQILSMLVPPVEGEPYVRREADQQALSRLEADPRFRTRVAALRAMLTDLRDAGKESALFAVGPDQRRALIELWPASAATRTGELIEGLREIVLRLVFDSLIHPSAAGFRGSGAARMIRFEADERMALSLRISPSPLDGTMSVSGQLEGITEGSRAALSLGGSLPTEPSAAELTWFNLEADGYFEVQIPGGVYDLRIESGQRSLVARSLDLRSGAGEG